MIQFDWCPSKKRRSGHRLTQREDHVMTQGEDSRLHAKERCFRGNCPDRHLDLWYWESIHFCFQVPQPEGLCSGPEPSDTAVGTDGAEI